MALFGTELGQGRGKDASKIKELLNKGGYKGPLVASDTADGRVDKMVSRKSWQ